MGVLTWIFIDGNLSFLVGDFISTGTLDTSTMVLVAVVAFGLSMDYEVFLLSRIKEEHDAGNPTSNQSHMDCKNLLELLQQLLSSWPWSSPHSLSVVSPQSR